MEENTIVEQQKSRKFSILDPKVLAIASLVVLFLASTMIFFSDIMWAFAYNYPRSLIFDILFDGFGDIIVWTMGGLLLPASLFFIGAFNKNPLLPKIALIVSGVILATQLMAALLMAILALAGSGSNVLTKLVSLTSGSNTLSSLIYLLKNLFSNSIRYLFRFRTLITMSANLLTAAGGFCYILANAVCAFGFLKLSFLKK